VTRRDWDIDTLKATLDVAQRDLDAENDRMKVLDSKLSSLATFSGLTLSVTATLGANVVVAGRLCQAFTVALGAVLVLAALALLLGVFSCFRGLRPKEYRGITLKAAASRVTPTRLGLPPQEALPVLAATYYTDLLPAARAANNVKLDRVVDAFRWTRLGLGLLVGALVLAVVGAVA